MQIKKIEAYRSAYKAYLSNPQSSEHLYIWETQKVFQENWNLDTDDLSVMYDQCLQNTTTRRLWNREAYAPKAMMLEFIQMQAHYFREMFQDLFNESKSVEGRIGRFGFYCDQLLDAYLEAHPGRKIDSHHHNDGYEMISLYLSFRYPDQYLPYSLGLFQDVMDKIGAVDPPLTHDTERYFKVARTLYKLLQKEEGLIEIHRKRLQPGLHYMEESLLLVYDYCKFIQSH